jgi:hypothetical protein
MKPSVAADLKLYAVKHRWAFEELVLDQKATEWNLLCSSPHKEQWAYLKDKLGGRAALQALEAWAGETHLAVPAIFDPAARLKELVKRYPFILEEPMYHVKVREYEELSKSVQGMYGYLLECFSTPEAVLSKVKWLVGVQSGPRKTINV